MEEWEEQMEKMIDFGEPALHNEDGTVWLSVRAKDLLKAALIYEIYQDRLAKTDRETFRLTFAERLTKTLRDLQSTLPEATSKDSWNPARDNHVAIKLAQGAEKQWEGMKETGDINTKGPMTKVGGLTPMSVEQIHRSKADIYWQVILDVQYDLGHAIHDKWTTDEVMQLIDDAKKRRGVL